MPELGTQENIFGTAGPTQYQRFNDGGDGRGGEWTGAGPLVNIDGQQFIRTRTDDPAALASFDPYGGGYFHDPTYGMVVPLDVASSRTAASEDFFDKYGVLLAGAGVAAVTSPAWLGSAAMGTGGLSESAIAEIIAAEGGFSALPSTGMAGTAISGASGGGFWDAIMQATTGAVNSGGGFSMEELMKMVMGKNPWGNIFNIGRGIYGLHQSRDMQKLAEQAMKTENPFGPYRDEYAQKLRGLYADPSSITKMPGYEAGIQAVNRGLAKSGYLGSGNQMTALQKFGGDFFNAEAERLAMLAGAKFPPGGGSQLLQGSIAAKQLEGNALNTLIYGALGAGASGVFGRGGGNSIPGGTGGGNPIPGGTPPIFAPTEAYNYDFDGADLGNLLALIG